MPLLGPWRGRPTPAIDVFDREAVFIDRVLDPLRRRLPELRDRARAHHHEEAVRLRRAGRPRIWRRRSPRIISSINRNAHFRRAASARIFIACRSPSARSIGWRCAGRRSRATPHFFLGTDSAPHPVLAKETRVRLRRHLHCASCALEIYAQVFEEEGALDRLEAFASLNGPKFYRLPVNRDAGDLAARAARRAGTYRQRRHRRGPVSRRRHVALAPFRLRLGQRILQREASGRRRAQSRARPRA